MEIRKAETPEFWTIWGEVIYSIEGKKETQPRNHRDVNLKSASKRDKRTLTSRQLGMVPKK